MNNFVHVFIGRRCTDSEAQALWPLIQEKAYQDNFDLKLLDFDCDVQHAYLALHGCPVAVHSARSVGQCELVEAEWHDFDLFIVQAYIKKVDDNCASDGIEFEKLPKPRDERFKLMCLFETLV